MNTYFVVNVNNDINNTIKGLDSAVYAKYPQRVILQHWKLLNKVSKNRISSIQIYCKKNI